jgi:mannose-6-phosphate isomerase-like protein (cupin superfamily)
MDDMASGLFVAAPLAGGRLAPPGGGLVLVEWADDGTAGARPIAGLHVHHDDDEAWYVLDGQLGFRLGDDVVEAGPGAAVMAPAGVAHSYWNAGGGPARYVLVMTARVAALIDELHSPGACDYHEIFRRHASELL